MFKVLRNGLLRYILYTCPNLWCISCSKCYGMDCFGTYFTHVQTIKGTLRRMNNVGRFAASSKKKKVQVLAAARLHRCPGLFSVLTAWKEYREACFKGTCAVSPSNAFHPDALDWLDSELQEEKPSWNTKKNLTKLHKSKKALKHRTVGSANVPVCAYIYIYMSN